MYRAAIFFKFNVVLTMHSSKLSASSGGFNRRKFELRPCACGGLPLTKSAGTPLEVSASPAYR